LGTDDTKAKSLVIESIDNAAYTHILSKKILDRLSTAEGPLTAIFPSGIDLGILTSYNSFWPMPDDEDFQYDGATSERTTMRMARFVADYLGSTADAVVICEDWMASRASIPNMKLNRPRIACFGDDEVYYLLTPGITDLDAIEDTVVPMARYQTGVCSTCASVPDGDIPDEGFLDEVTRNARHVFVPAFDGSGYLIWSLKGE
jgi:hypothetical protein